MADINVTAAKKTNLTPLRTDPTRRAAVKALERAMAQAIAEAHTRIFDKMLERSAEINPRGSPYTFIDIFSKVEKPVLVHCGVGSRVAAVYYAWLVAKEGMSRDEALARAKEHGLWSESLVAPVDVYLDRKGE